MAIVMGLAGCTDPVPEIRPSERPTGLAGSRPRITFGFLEQTEGRLSLETYHPLLDCLDSRAPFRFHALLGTDSERVIGFLEEGLADVAHLDVLSYIEARRQLEVKPLVKTLNRDGEPVSRSIFVTRQDSPLESLPDMRGRSLALGSFHSTLGNLVPRFELARNGISREDLTAIESLPDDHSVAMAVLKGRYDAGAVSDLTALQFRPQGLRFLHVSDAIPSGPVVAREDVPDSVARSLIEALLTMKFADAHERSDWNEKLRYGFAPASDADYDLVRQIINRIPPGCAEGCHPDVKF